MFACLIWLQVHGVTIEASHSRYLRRPGRVFNLFLSFVLDLNHSDQWNTLLSAEGEIFLLTSLETLLGIRYMYLLFWSSSVLQLLSESRLLLQLSSVRSTIWLSPFKFETSRSIQIWAISIFMLCFHTQFSSVYLYLVFFWLDPSFSLCFGNLQGTTPTLCTRRGATAWAEWAVHGATACILLARSSAEIESPCQH